MRSKLNAKQLDASGTSTHRGRQSQTLLSDFWGCTNEGTTADTYPQIGRHHQTTGSSKTIRTSRDRQTPRMVLPVGQLLLRDAWASLARENIQAASETKPTLPSLARERSSSRAPTNWPFHIAGYMDKHEPHHQITFETIEPFVCCECEDPCRFGSCPNSTFHNFCSANCCPYEGRCGNGLLMYPRLQLRYNQSRFGYGVYAEGSIDEGVIIGEYVGERVVRRYNEEGYNEGYVLQMKATAQERPSLRVYIDASNRGNITRFMNHSCAGNAVFEEVCNGDRHAVVVVTTEPIEAGDEVTVNYGDRLWFLCECGHPGCCHRDLHGSVTTVTATEPWIRN